MITVEAGEAQGHIEANSRHVFNLTTGPLFRARLLHMSGQDHVLLICMHHIISDGWSMGVFTREAVDTVSGLSARKGQPSASLANPVRGTMPTGSENGCRASS